MLSLFDLKIETWSSGQCTGLNQYTFDLALDKSHQYILDCINMYYY